MLASSGIDGAYMAKWMPPTASWLGYVLNTVSDVASMVLMYQYGRILQTRRNESGGKRKLELSWALGIAEVLAVLYSWFFSWRQLLIVLPQVEAQATRWVAPLAAGFIPLLLASAGYAQSLLAGRIEKEEDTEDTEKAPQDTERLPQFSDNGGSEPYRVCALCAFTAKTPQAWAGHCKGAEHKRRSAEFSVVMEGMVE